MATITIQQQKGFTLLEGMVALTILLSLLVLGAQHLNQQLTQRLHQAAADHLRSVATAVQHYASDHYDELSATLEPTPLPFQALKNYLPISFEPNNVYGQRYLIQVTPPPAQQNLSSSVLQEDVPANSQLQLLVLTCEGQEIVESSLLQIAQQVGGGGGHLSINILVPSAADPSILEKPDQPYIIGAYQGWQLKVPMQTIVIEGEQQEQPLTTLGHLAHLSYLSAQEIMSANKLLHRQHSRWQPDGSTMETDLALQAHTITFNDIGNSTATGTINAQSVTLKQEGAHIQLSLQQNNQGPGIELQRAGNRLLVNSERVTIKGPETPDWCKGQVQKYSAAELHRYWNKVTYYELLGRADDQNLDHFAGQVCNRSVDNFDEIATSEERTAAVGRLFLLGHQESDRAILYLCGPVIRQDLSARSSSTRPVSSAWRIRSFGSEGESDVDNQENRPPTKNHFKNFFQR